MNPITSDYKNWLPYIQKDNSLSSYDKLCCMFEAGYREGYEKGLTYEFDVNAYLANKPVKKTSFKKVVIQYGLGAILISFALYGWLRDAQDAKAKYNRIHSALGALYIMRTDGMPIQESQDDPVQLLEE